MARKQKLKVYRTPIGFHDAYVAAPSQKAALAAWKSDVDLFARGVAETVTDDSLTREPLEKPATVIKRSRGTSAEFMAALPKDKPRRTRATATPTADEGPPPRRPNRSRPANAAPQKRESARQNRSTDARPPVPKPKARAKPRPSRAKLEAAEAALEDAGTKHRTAIEAIREQEKALQQKRRDLERRHEAALAGLEATIAKERERYAAALQTWRD